MTEQTTFKTPEAKLEATRRWRQRKRQEKAAAQAPKPPRMTEAEKKRRQRARKRLAADEVQTFLEAIVTKFNKAIEQREQVDVPSWLPGRAAEAMTMLEELAAIRPNENLLTTVYLCLRPPFPEDYDPNTEEGEPEPLDDDERLLVTVAHNEAFEAWMASGQSGFTAVKSTGRVEADQKTVQWSHEQLTAGKENSATLTHGMRAAKQLIKYRARPEQTQAYAEFTARVCAIAMMSRWGGPGFEAVPYFDIVYALNEDEESPE